MTWGKATDLMHDMLNKMVELDPSGEGAGNPFYMVKYNSPESRIDMHVCRLLENEGLAYEVQPGMYGTQTYCFLPTFAGYRFQENDFK